MKKFVELQSGQVTVDSVPGQGSVFLVTLPLRSRVVPAEAPVPTAPHLPGANRVLVVEDDMMAYQTLARGLSEAGYFPVRARLGEEALQMARLLKPTALTLDLALPDLSGWEVLKGLKRDTATREIPVVIVSIMDNQELGLALGADDYFVKPVDRPRLIARLQELAPLSGAPRGGRLLLIDDDPAVHDVLDEALVPLGYTVDHAFSGHQGLDQAMACTPDVVILDLLMPDVSGFEVAEALQEREETSHVPIVVLTFKDLTARERESLRGKIAAFVQKGHTGPRQLVSAIRELESRHGREGDRGR